MSSKTRLLVALKEFYGAGKKVEPNFESNHIACPNEFRSVVLDIERLKALPCTYSSCVKP